MKFDAGTRTRLLVAMTLDFDPTGSEVEVKVDDTWHAATWLATPVSAAGKWKQTARTDNYFAGPEATPNGATQLTAARHHTQTRITTGADVIVSDSTPLDVS